MLPEPRLEAINKMATLYKTNGEVVEVQPENGKRFTLEECYSLIGCELVERVELKKWMQMICDEEGAINGSDINHKASAIMKETYGAYAQEIYGNVIVCRTREF